MGYMVYYFPFQQSSRGGATMAGYSTNYDGIKETTFKLPVHTFT